MYSVYRLVKDLLYSKKGEIPGWMFIVGLILGLFALIILIYIAVKSGKGTVEQLGGLG